MPMIAHIKRIIWRIVITTGIPLLGFSMILIGFVYDALFAGIPYQDPTPELLAQWEYQRSVAGLFYKTGGIVLLMGVLAAPIIWIRIRRKEGEYLAEGDNPRSATEK